MSHRACTLYYSGKNGRYVLNCRYFIGNVLYFGVGFTLT